MLPMVLPHLHKVQGAGLRESPEQKALVAFVQYTDPNNEWFELEIPVAQVEPLLIRLQQIRDDLRQAN